MSQNVTEQKQKLICIFGFPAPGGVGEENMFPHLYNGLRLGNAEVESMVELKRDTEWDAAIKKLITESWLIY